MTRKRTMTRRRFLTGAGAAAAGLHFVPAAALGRDGAVAPSDRVTMGFIGVGSQGRGHLLGGAWTYVTGGYVARKDVQVLAVCDTWRQRREDACGRVNGHYAERFGKGSYTACKTYVDFRKVLLRSDIDAVLIGTPIHWHAIMSIMAAEAGKDVYCEKPTAVTIRESQALVRAVDRYGRIYQAGTQQRSEYDGKFRRALEFVRSGRIGKLKSIYANIGGGGLAWRAGFGPARPVPDGLDWDLWLGPAPWSPYDGNAGAHRFGTGGINWGQHHYDIVQCALGAETTGPVKIGFEDGKLAHRYANGVVVYGCRYPGERVGGSGGATFVGSEGRIAVDRESLVAYPRSIIERPVGPDEVHLYRNAGHSDNFLQCVRTRKRPICDARTTHRGASIMLLGDIAERLRRQLTWDPARERFVGDDEANRLLSAAKRPPWRV